MLMLILLKKSELAPNNKREEAKLYSTLLGPQLIIGLGMLIFSFKINIKY